ncbi:MAG: hypothetical protein WCH57_00830 [Verrucomicrobiota bacterium]
MKKQTAKIRATEARFDKEGYQLGKPNIQGEPIDFSALAKGKPLSRKEVAALGLPTPEQLAGKTDTVKISLAVDREALAFFKFEAKRLGTSYQRMMRNLLTSYSHARR